MCINIKCTAGQLFTYVHTNDVTTTQIEVHFQKVPHAPSKSVLCPAEYSTSDFCHY